MKLSMSLAAFALAFAVGVFGVNGQARADDKAEEVIGIIGEVMTGAIEAEQEAKQAERCDRWEAKCEDGADWACNKVEELCGE